MAAEPVSPPLEPVLATLGGGRPSDLAAEHLRDQVNNLLLPKGSTQSDTNRSDGTRDEYQQAVASLLSLDVTELTHIVFAGSDLVPYFLDALAVPLRDDEDIFQVLNNLRISLALSVSVDASPSDASTSSSASLPSSSDPAVHTTTSVPIDQAMITMLASLQTPYIVRASSPHGENNCLTDSILRSLVHQTLLKPLSPAERKKLCREARQHLHGEYGLSRRGFPFLRHDSHARGILRFLVASASTIWLPDIIPLGLQFSPTVLDRWNRALLPGSPGEVSEIPETNVVSIEPADLDVEQYPVVILLYCHTFRNGDGYHYDWIFASTASASDSQHATASSSTE